ncbi:MAG: hypothetical protein ACREL6_04485, partial [Gemmatimonadales bacterium]
MSGNLRNRRLALCCGLLAVAAACGEDALSPEEADLATLRQAAESFTDFGAIHQDYDVLVIHPVNGRTCLRDSTLGAMGAHFLNTALVVDTVLAATPEVTIYEMQEDSSFEFVAVEYIIPFTIRGEDEEPPVLFGREFVQNHTFNLWALHAWVGRDNPRGIFEPWNP